MTLNPKPEEDVILHHLIRALRGCLVCLALLVSACASRNLVEKPLSQWTPEPNRRATEQVAGDRSQEMLVMVAYLAREKRPWLHLVDGGIADNLGLRSFYDSVNLVGDPRTAFRKLRHPDVRRILIISVNAHARQSRAWALKRKSPSLMEVLGSMSGDQILTLPTGP